MSNPLFPSVQIGDLTVTAISDGYLSAGLDLLSNIAPADASTIQDKAGVTNHSAIHINCYLVRGGGRTVLVDAGAGGFKQWGGRLMTNLPLAGVQPCEIDTILLTHAHPDHIGGLLDAAGAVMFPQAELLVHDLEVAFWEDDGNLSRASERARGNFAIARRTFDAYRTRLRAFKAGEVHPGMTAMALPGHTAGHTGYRIESENQSLLVWGDIVHFPEIQITRPDVSIAFDQDLLLSAQTRLRLLDLVSSEQVLIAGMHLSNRGFAHIVRSGGGYAIAYEA